MRIQHATAALRSLAAAAALALATTVPAHAGTSAATDPQTRAAAACPQGFVCFWPEPSFAGEMRAVRDPQHECAATPVQPARSVYNHGSASRSFYSAPHCSVHVGTLEPGGTARSISVSSWE